MLKFVTIVGARPQFIKAAAISRVFKNESARRAGEVMVNTGQHYDDYMSKVFFEELEIPEPHYSLEVGSGTHGNQTGQMIMKIEEVLDKERPDMVIVYGDTNSTLAGALAAAKMNIPVAHVEAGLRSFNKSMPEEINRILTDNISTLLFCPTGTSFENLVKEGFPAYAKPPYSVDNPKVFRCGDVMYDNALYFAKKAENISGTYDKLKLSEKGYVLCTIHRDNNTDNPGRLNALFESLNNISSESKIRIVLPLHPRAGKMISHHLDQALWEDVRKNKYFILTGPISYLDMLVMEKHSIMIMTDSGGVQKEAYFFNKPCVVLRKESEWKELLDAGTTLLADTDEHRIHNAFRNFMENAPTVFPPIFGDGKAAEFIFDEMIKSLS